MARTDIDSLTDAGRPEAGPPQSPSSVRTTRLSLRAPCAHGRQTASRWAHGGPVHDRLPPLGWPKATEGGPTSGTGYVLWCAVCAAQR